jgi:hypothetical protein
MSDNHRRYDAIKRGLLQFFEKPPQGRQAQYLETLTKMVSGLVGAKNAHLSSMADKAPDNAKRESRIKRFSRFLDNEKINHATFFAPFARALLVNLSNRPLVLAIDGSTVGQGCMALMINVIYRGRALPIGWLVVKGKKGHLSQELHLELLRQIKPLLPTQTEVVLVGDGEFDGTDWLAELEKYQWHFVCRTAKNSCLWLGDDQTKFAGLSVEPDSLIEIGGVIFTKEEYGPVMAIAHWEAKYEEPHYLVTNFALAEEAVWYYKKRFGIETFFSDSKSRGFRIDRSHLSDPSRLARLLLATCLGYLWLVYLGTVALAEGWDKIIHRTDRCDLSLFSLGVSLLEHFLNQTMPLPVAFVPILLE